MSGEASFAKFYIMPEQPKIKVGVFHYSTLSLPVNACIICWDKRQENDCKTSCDQTFLPSFDCGHVSPGEPGKLAD